MRRNKIINNRLKELSQFKSMGELQEHLILHNQKNTNLSNTQRRILNALRDASKPVCGVCLLDKHKISLQVLYSETTINNSVREFIKLGIVKRQTLPIQIDFDKKTYLIFQRFEDR